MEYREIEAITLDEAKMKIRREYGDSARIIKVTENTNNGFFGLGRKKSVKVLISITDTDLLRKYKENMGIKNLNAVKGNNKINVSDSNESISLSLIMEKLNKIENEMSKNRNKEDDIHSNILEIRQILQENEFYDDFINNIIENINNDLPYSKIEDRLEVHKYVYNFIMDKLIVPKGLLKKTDDKKVFILVGPTGVGKTTTIAKIAANAIKEKLKVELITIDGYRIGAKYQLEKYAEYMRTQMSSIEDNLELQKIVDLSDANLILIDTIGRSARDEMNLVKMKQLLKLNNCHADYILTICASVKKSEVKKVFKSFNIFDYQSIIITKVDESESVGAIINDAIEKKCEIKFYTNGQKVPSDIERADKTNIMSLIKGLEAEVYLSSVSY